MNKQPEYLCVNPAFNLLEKNVMTRNEYQTYIDVWGSIGHVVVKAPMKLYLCRKKPDITDINSYPLQSFIRPVSNDI